MRWEEIDCLEFEEIYDSEQPERRKLSVSGWVYEDPDGAPLLKSLDVVRENAWECIHWKWVE